jgi:mannose-1-phosphate guanylyltransferase / phosphomannomutase
VHDPAQYGVVELARDGRVVRFQEKPGPGQAFSNLANTGIYCVEPEVLAHVPPGRVADWSHDVFPRLMAMGQPLCGHELTGYWRDIGSIREYYRAQQDALAGSLQIDIPGIKLSPGLWVGPNAHIAPGAVVKGPVILGAGCRIEPDALILPGTILGAGTVVSRGACVWGAILGAGCHVGPRTMVRDCIIDDDVRIGADSLVSTSAVIGHGSCLEAGVQVGSRPWTKPEMELPGRLDAPVAATARPFPLRSEKQEIGSCVPVGHLVSSQR